MNKIRIASNIALIFLTLYCSLVAGWYAGYSNYFFYPVIYELQDIQGHVHKFAPENRHGRENFVYTTPSVHISIFNEMLQKVEHCGEGLRDIEYTAGGAVTSFLTEDEVLHLQDVADLLSFLRNLGKAAFAALIILVFAMVRYRIWPYYIYTALIIITGFFMTGALLLYRFGFEKIFYLLHELVFPEGHKWFFYYQDSLMSTMLKAPDSFVDFGAVLGVCTLISFLAFYWIVSLIIRSFIDRYR